MKSEFKMISDELFLEIGKKITERYGIKMPMEKKIMFQARLQKRLRELKMNSLTEYTSLLLQENGDKDEFIKLADFISTNKTEFFREIEHFNYLTNVVLPGFIASPDHKLMNQLKIWSAGCSSGQEAYSLAITIEEFCVSKKVIPEYSIHATDISSKMLKLATEAIYPFAAIEDISQDMKHAYFLKGKNLSENKVRVIKEIRDKVKFSYLNMMDQCYPFNFKFDLVFLRNTLIYFDSGTQLSVLKKVVANLKTGGHLFIGHSESLINLNLPIVSVAPSVYQKVK